MRIVCCETLSAGEEHDVNCATRSKIAFSFIEEAWLPVLHPYSMRLFFFLSEAAIRHVDVLF